MDILQYFLTIALGQGIVLAFFLLTSEYYKSVANTCLALALIAISILCITDIIGNHYTPSSILIEFFINDLELGFLVYVPLYYFFKISTSSAHDKSGFNLYLLLAFAIDTIINIAIVWHFPIEKIATDNNIQLFYEIESILSIFFNLFLCYKSYQLIKDYKNDSKKKEWIYKIWQSTLALLAAWVLMTLGSYISSSSISILINTLYIFISIWLFWLIYNGIVNLKLIDDRKNINLKLEGKEIQKEPVFLQFKESTVVKEIYSKKQHNSKQKINNALLDSHFNNINSLIVSESLYRNENLSIEDVAHRVNMSTGYISKIVKEATKKNFPNWINEFRVAETKAMFLNKEFDNYTTLSIGLEAGFKSKSAFYATFKKITGDSPAKFRKKKS